jgi:hypothetical protein
LTVACGLASEDTGAALVSGATALVVSGGRLLAMRATVPRNSTVKSVMTATGMAAMAVQIGRALDQKWARP